MKFTLFSLLLILTTILNAQEIDLWSDLEQVPGFPSDYQHKPPVNKDNQRLTEISKPFMRIFPAKTKPNGKALIIFPGGAYRILAYKKEGNQIATHFASKGFTCFVLHYRVSEGNHQAFKFPGPLLDARQSIRLVKTLALKYQFSPDEVGIIGFSAGGHLASMCATRFDEKIPSEPQIINHNVRPKFAALIYPVASMIAPTSHKGSKKALFGDSPTEEQLIAASPERQVKKSSPPLFIAHNQFDPVDAKLSIALTEAYTREKVPCELHLFPKSAHGFGMGRPGESIQKQPAIIWPQLLLEFIER